MKKQAHFSVQKKKVTLLEIDAHSMAKIAALLLLILIQLIMAPGILSALISLHSKRLIQWVTLSLMIPITGYVFTYISCKIINFLCKQFGGVVLYIQDNSVQNMELSHQKIADLMP